MIDQLEEDGHFDSAEVFINPPSDADQSEIDSADEDSGGTLNNLSGRQLRSAALATVKVNGKRHVYLDVDDEDDGEPDEHLAATI